MGFLEAMPLEFKDFSGGLTDNFLQGDPKRFAKGDNFVLTTDHKLEIRQGTVIFDPTGYTLPGASGRVGALFTNKAETLLFAQADRKIYTQVGGSTYGKAWTTITGPTGNEALGGGDQYSQLSTAEFQKQIYYTSTAQVQPGKIFIDENNSWKALTAGLPRMQWTAQTDADILAKCIVLANDIRQSMVQHLADNANQASGTSTTHQHNKSDKWSLSYFQAVSWSGTDPESPGKIPAPTPAPAASDQTSLFTLCAALAQAYEHHRNDLAGSTPTVDGSVGSLKLHQNQITTPTGDYVYNKGALGINIKLTRSGAVTSVQKAGAFLDELKQKWNWHQLSPYSHSPTNDLGIMSKYLVTAPKVGTQYPNYATVQITENYADFIAFADWLRYVYNRHATNQENYHSQSDVTSTSIPLAAPNDFDSAALTIFWARWLYGAIHYPDATVATHTGVTFDTTAGSNALTNVATTATGAALALPVGSFVTAYFIWADPNDPSNLTFTSARGAKVLTSSAGNATVSWNALATNAGNSGQYSTANWHINQPSSFVDSTASNGTVSEQLATGKGAVGTDLSTWLTLGSEFTQAFGAHYANPASHLAAPFGSMANSFLHLGTPILSAINGNPFFIPTAVSLSWGAFYQYQYTVEPAGIIYESRGNPDFSFSTQTCPSYPVNTVISSVNTNYYGGATIVQQNACATITGIPSLANDPSTNYDTVTSVAPVPETGFAPDLTIELYRTTDGGTTFYYLDSLTNGTSSYSDVTNDTLANAGDTVLNTRPTIYTSGSVVADDLPPKCRYIHRFQEYVYYGDIEDTGQFFPQRVRQSKADNPDAAPATFFDDVEDSLMGLSSTKSNLLGLCKNSIYRFSGAFTDTGQGGMIHEQVVDSKGCVSTRSIVRTEEGVFFAGTDGFYFTDGFQCIKISLELNATYASLVQSEKQASRIHGCYDKLMRRIWWGVQSNPTSSDNDAFFVFYLDYGIKPSGVFTKAFTTTSWMPSSAVFFQGRLVIGDSRNYLFKTDASTKNDPTVDTSKNPSQWIVSYIPWAYRSCALDFGTTFKRKWVTKIHCVGQNVGNASIQINSINDANTNPDGTSGTTALAPLQYVKNLLWGDVRVVWADASVVWKYDGAMDAWRRFRASSMRSDFKQIEYVPGNFVVYRSDDYPGSGFAHVVASRAVLYGQLKDGGGFYTLTFPLDVVGMSISFSTDNYQTQYAITGLAVSNQAVDFVGTAPTDSLAKWQISGYRTQNRIRITSFDVHFAYLGDENEAYPGDSGAGGKGANA